MDEDMPGMQEMELDADFNDMKVGEPDSNLPEQERDEQQLVQELREIPVPSDHAFKEEPELEIASDHIREI